MGDLVKAPLMRAVNLWTKETYLLSVSYLFTCNSEIIVESSSVLKRVAHLEPVTVRCFAVFPLSSVSQSHNYSIILDVPTANLQTSSHSMGYIIFAQPFLSVKFIQFQNGESSESHGFSHYLINVADLI